MAKDKQSNVKKDNVKKVKENKKSYFKDFKAELKKVSWPTFKQLVKNTSAVVAIVIFTAVIIFVLDVIFESLNNFGVNKLKELVTSDNEVTETMIENVVSSEAIDTTSAEDAIAENVVGEVVSE
jgi:preprotein translocase subunit SecE